MLSASSDQSAWGSGEHHRWTLGQLEGTPSNSQTQPRRRGAHRWGPGEPLAWQVWVGGRCVNTQAQWPPQEPAPAAQVPPGPGSCPSPRQPSRPRPWAPGSPRTCRHGVPPPLSEKGLLMGRMRPRQLAQPYRDAFRGPAPTGEGPPSIPPSARVSPRDTESGVGTRELAAPAVFRRGWSKIDALRIAGPASPQPALISSSHWLINTVSIKTDRHSPPGSRGKPK